jgi:PEP-CTERM motif
MCKQIRIINPKVTSNIMKHILGTSFGIAAAALAFAIQAQGQSVNFTFSDGTADGWANSGFGNPPPLANIANIGGQNYLSIPMGGYQVANVNSQFVSGTPASTFNSAFLAALEHPANYEITYNYYIDTSTFTTPGTYIQLATYINTGSGYYGSTGTPSAYEPQFNGTQVASGNVFSGSATIPFSAYGTDASAATENYFRLGLIINGDGTGVKVNFTDISISPVPEPSTLALIGLGAAATMLMLRRRLA